MKKNILLGCLLVLSFNCFSQKGQRSIGLVAGGNISTPTLFNGYKGEFDDDDNFERSLFAPTAGVYYNSDLNNRLGFSIAVNYQNWKTNFSCPECRSVDAGFIRFYKSQFSMVDVPINLVINLRDKQEASWRPYFTVGYTYSQLVQYKFTNLETNEEFYRGIGDNIKGFNYHYLNTGFEVRHNFENKLMLAICPVMRIPLNDETSSISKYYFGAQVKLGRLL